MPKLCIFPGCGYNQFGGKYCKNHQYKRTDKKKKPIPVRSKKPSILGRERNKLTQADRIFYAQIWAKRPHIDFETGDPIYGEMLTLYFHHVLPKGVERFKQFRYCEWNIVLVNWNNHTNADNAMLFTPKIKIYYQYLINNLDQIEDGILIPEFNHIK